MVTSGSALIGIVGQVSYSDIRLLLEYVNQWVCAQDSDVEVRITFVESPSEGRYLTRPESRGGPGFRVRFAVPVEKVEGFQGYLRTEKWHLSAEVKSLG